MLALGIDLGTSFVKVSVYDTESASCIASARYPEHECAIISKKTGWAEQSPIVWWQHVSEAIRLLNARNIYKPDEIGAIGIAYQMHGLVCLDEHNNVLRDSIIWCDSRAVETGNEAFLSIGKEYCLENLLNSPGNFTASKLAWVSKNEPELFAKINKIMLPGDYIGFRMTGEVSTTISALSEGIFWDFSSNTVSKKLMEHFHFMPSIIPAIKNCFDLHGFLQETTAKELGLKKGIPISYKAGDQPNNALSLNVMNPGEVAATAGTSGVIYSVTEKPFYDEASRVNTFAHVNHQPGSNSLGVLMCINSAGILYKYIRSLVGQDLSYESLNSLASSAPAGSEGLTILPFGNGAERILGNRTVGCSFSNINFNIHTRAHITRAALEGIAFAFNYGLKIMEQQGIRLSVIRAPMSNLFLSDVFTKTFVNTTGLPLELYECDGSIGAAKGAAIGASCYKDLQEALSGHKAIRSIYPEQGNRHEQLFEHWKSELHKSLQ